MDNDLPNFILDLSDEGIWLIKEKNGKKYYAGYNKELVIDLIERLNSGHRPNIMQGEHNEILVCWNLHEKYEDCEYIKEI